MFQYLYNWLVPICTKNDYLCDLTQGGFSTPDSLLNLANKMPFPPYISQIIVGGFVGWYLYKRHTLKEAMIYIKAGLIARGFNLFAIEIVLTGLESIFEYLIEAYKNWKSTPVKPKPVVPVTPHPRRKKRTPEEIEEMRRRGEEILDGNRTDIGKLRPARSMLTSFSLQATQAEDTSATFEGPTLDSIKATL